MSQYQDLCCILSAVGVATDPEGKGTHLLYINPERSCLISKLWVGGNRFGAQDFITDSVRLNSSAPYLFTPTTQLIICVSPTDELRVLRNEDDEWFDEENTPDHKVHSDGKVAAVIGTDDRVRIFFQDPSKRLIVLEKVDESWTPAVLPAEPVEGSPIATSTVDDKVHVFYLSAKDNYIHYVVEETDGNWNDMVFASCSLQAEKVEPKQFMATRAPESTSFEVHVLTKEDTLLSISQDEETSTGKLTTYGKLDDQGEFVAEANAEFGFFFAFLGFFRPKIVHKHYYF
jgi:hypothetical protein